MQQNENFAKQAEQAEAERPEVVAYFDRNYPSTGDAFIWSNYEGSPYEPVMTVSQHERIVGELRAKADQLREALEWRKENQAGQRERLRSVTAERDAALARVAELEQQEPLKLSDDVREFLQEGINSVMGGEDADMDYEFASQLGKLLDPVYAAPVAQAQHSVPEGWKPVPIEPLLNMMSDKDHDTRITATPRALPLSSRSCRRGLGSAGRRSCPTLPSGGCFRGEAFKGALRPCFRSPER